MAICVSSIPPWASAARTRMRSHGLKAGPGLALAFGRIDDRGNVTLSSNLSNANVSHTYGNQQAYCFYNIPAKNIMVTLDASTDLSGFLPSAFAEIGDPTSACPSGGECGCVFDRQRSRRSTPYGLPVLRSLPLKYTAYA